MDSITEWSYNSNIVVLVKEAEIILLYLCLSV